MNIPATVLIVENDPEVASGLQLWLLDAGYYVQTASFGRQAIEIVRSRPVDLVLLSGGLPEQSGHDMCRKLRMQSTIPIILMVDSPHCGCCVQSLEAGADDCIIKPVNTRELQARINAIFRRIAFTSTTHNRQIQIGNICLDPVAHKVLKHNREVALRQKEYELLYVLMSRPGQVISRAELLDQVWGVNWLGDTRTLDVHIRWVREKIEDNPGQPRYIQTVRGVGYRFATAEATSLSPETVANFAGNKSATASQIPTA
ncbi:MAG: response regulator transcription factor [Anaerolineae bacterium]